MTEVPIQSIEGDWQDDEASQDEQIYSWTRYKDHNFDDFYTGLFFQNCYPPFSHMIQKIQKTPLLALVAKASLRSCMIQNFGGTPPFHAHPPSIHQ